MLATAIVPMSWRDAYVMRPSRNRGRLGAATAVLMIREIFLGSLKLSGVLSTQRVEVAVLEKPGGISKAMKQQLHQDMVVMPGRERWRKIELSRLD